MPLTSTRTFSGDTTANKNARVCHAPVSVIMGNHRRCRFSGRCEEVSKGEEFSAVWSLRRSDGFHTPAGRNYQSPQTRRISQTFKRSCHSIADKEVMNSLCSSWAQEVLHTFYARSSSLLRCNTCVSLKRRKSSQGKWLLMCFRYCLVFHSCERSYLIYEASSSHRRITAGIPRAQISK